MGLFDQFPYTNFHELNLDWLIRLIKELENTVNNFVALNTIKYADPIQWNITTQYEANTVVVNPQTGTAYISSKAVPAGVALTNTEYWSVIFTLDIISANKNLTLRDDGSNVLATFASDAGDWLLWNGTLYKVTQAINVNEAYVDGYNLTRYTIELFIKDYIDLINTKIGDLDNLDTTDKSNIVAAINEIVDNVTTIQNFINKHFNFITFEEYGAEGDGVTDDTQAIIDAITDAAANNKIVTSLNGTYLISDDITVPANCKLHNIGVITSSIGNTITVNNGSEIVGAYLNNVKIITFGYFTRLQHIKIRDILSGYAIHIKSSSGFTTNDIANQKVTELYDDIMIVNTADNSTTGVYCECPDTFLSNIEVVNCMTGFRLAAENKAINCNCWLNTVITDFDSTIAFKIAGQGVRFVNCTADTVALAVSLPSEYYSVIFNGFEIYFNSAVKQNCTFKFINYYGDFSGELVVHIPNAASNNNKFYLQYQSHLHVSMIDGSAQDFSQIANSATSSEGGTISQLNCKHNSDIFIYKMTITYSTPLANGTYDTISLDKNFADQRTIAASWNNRYFMPCLYNNGSVGLAQLDMRNSDFQVHSFNPPSGATGISEIYVNLTAQSSPSAL